jgi:uncharacterized protein YlxP (DUF503 family)
MATTVGLIHLEFHIPQAACLKDKRRAVKSFKDRLAHAFNVSVAEVASLDEWRRGVLAAAVVANDKHYLETVVQKIVNTAMTDREMILAHHEVQWL